MMPSASPLLPEEHVSQPVRAYYIQQPVSVIVVNIVFLKWQCGIVTFLIL